MSGFDKGLIDELEAEVLNQYLNVVWLEDYLNNGLEHVELVVKFDMEDRPEPKTAEEWMEAPIIGVEVKIKRKQSFGSQHFKQQLHFTVEEYNAIYKEMEESCKDPKYGFLYRKFGYSVRDLTCLLNQLATLRSDLEKLKNKEQVRAYKEILHGYSGLNTLTYGIKNPSLKRKIAKGRSVQGGYQKTVRDKKEIFFALLKEQVSLNGKYKNMSQAINLNIDEVMHRFKIFDEKWINSKREISLARIVKLNDESLEKTLTAAKKEKIEKEIVKLTEFVRQLSDGLSKGYPFEILDNILPYNTVYLDEVLKKVLESDKSIKEQCIESI